MRAGLTAIALVLLGVAVTAIAAGGPPAYDARAGRFDDWRAVEDSLRTMPRWEQVRWLAERGLPDPRYRAFVPDSQGLSCIGRWSYGPAVSVDVRATATDTIVFLSRGSGVSVIRFRGTEPLVLDLLADIDVEDTLVYTISADSFKVFCFADPGNPYLVGACRDSGYALDVDNGYAYLRDRWGMWILDATDPANPHRIASWGTDIAGVKVRGNHCYVAQGQMGSNSLHVLNVSDPAVPWEEGGLSGLTGEGIYLVDTLLFLPGFDVVNIADSSRPILVANEPAGGGEAWVHDSLRYGVTAGWTGGLRVLNLEDITDPVLDTTMLGTYSSVDISVRDGIACVASQEDYVRLLDVSDPVNPNQVGRYAAHTWFIGSVLNTGPLAYVPAYASTHDTVLHAVDITDPANPVMVGAVGGWEGPKAMVLQDSFLYAAEPYRFEVFSVADPRQPEWMGRCNLATSTSGISVQDTFVYLAPNIYTINVARPDQPILVGSTSCNCNDVAIRDTFCYVAHARDSLKVYSVAYPSTPRRLTSIWVYGQAYDVTLNDSYAYLGCSDFRIFDIADPAVPTLTGHYATPYRTFSIDLDSQYIYAACYLAGVCVLEQLPVAIREPDRQNAHPARRKVELAPNPVRRWARLVWRHPSRPYQVQVLDPLGRVVWRSDVARTSNRAQDLDFGSLRPGVYFLRCRSDRTEILVRFVRI